jgi:hypothetical protein
LAASWHNGWRHAPRSLTRESSLARVSLTDARLARHRRCLAFLPSTDSSGRAQVYPPGRVVDNSYDDWFYTKCLDELHPDTPFRASISPRTVTFHYVSAVETRYIYACLTSALCAEPDFPRGERNGGLSAYSKPGGEPVLQYLLSQMTYA